jgi:hypothetical protein
VLIIPRDDRSRPSHHRMPPPGAMRGTPAVGSLTLGRPRAWRVPGRIGQSDHPAGPGPRAPLAASARAEELPQTARQLCTRWSSRRVR